MQLNKKFIKMCIVRRQMLKTKHNRRERPLPVQNDTEKKICLSPPGQSLMDEDDTIRKPSDKSEITTK